VSRVLSGAGGGKVSEAVRRRVEEVARRLGYRPNLIARSLRKGKTNTVALLLPDIANPWFGAIASLVEQSLHRHGYTLMLANSGEDPDREAEYLALLPQKGIDGLIVAPLLRSRKALDQLLPEELPLVVFDRPVPGVKACVSTDPAQQTGILADTLERVGVKKVAMVSGPAHIVTHRVRDELIARRFNVIARHEGPAQQETGRQAFIRFLSLRPDAIVCTNNFLGEGVIDAIEKIEDPPIIACYDQIAMMHLLPLPIVCSVQDVPLMSEKCVELLLAQLEGRPGPAEPIELQARCVTNQRFQSLSPA